MKTGRFYTFRCQGCAHTWVAEKNVDGYACHNCSSRGEPMYEHDVSPDMNPKPPRDFLKIHKFNTGKKKSKSKTDPAHARTESVDDLILCRIILLESAVKSAAIKFKGKILIGDCHHNIIFKMVDSGLVKDYDDYVDNHMWRPYSKEGFVTHDNQFVTREQALQLARNNNQISVGNDSVIRAQKRNILHHYDIHTDDIK